MWLGLMVNLKNFMIVINDEYKRFETALPSILQMKININYKGI